MRVLPEAHPGFRANAVLTTENIPKRKWWIPYLYLARGPVEHIISAPSRAVAIVKAQQLWGRGIKVKGPYLTKKTAMESMKGMQ